MTKNTLPKRLKREMLNLLDEHFNLNDMKRIKDIWETNSGLYATARNGKVYSVRYVFHRFNPYIEMKLEKK